MLQPNHNPESSCSEVKKNLQRQINHHLKKLIDAKNKFEFIDDFLTVKFHNFQWINAHFYTCG